MTPWTWWAKEPDDESYGLAEEDTREACIAAACRELQPGETFEIVEAKASTARKHEGSDFIPFLHARNHEVVTVPGSIQ